MAVYRFQPQRQRPVFSDIPDVRGGEDPREIEITRTETTRVRDGIDATGDSGVNNDNVTVLSDLTTKTTASSRQTSPHLSYIHMHTQCYKIKSLAFL